MKRKLLIAAGFLLTQLCAAQVLFTENFENYTLGNLGTDPTGVIPGQGGWLTVTATQGTKNNNAFTIVNDPVKNKVFQFVLNPSSLDARASLSVLKPLNDLIDNRAPGNNVIKLEIDYYVGTASQDPISEAGFKLRYESTSYNKHLFSMSFNAQKGYATIFINNGQSNQNDLLKGPNFVLPFNKWYTFIVYLDYDNKKIYFEMPYFNTVAKADFLDASTSVNLFNDFKPFQLELHAIINDVLAGSQQVSRKFDNIKITALQSVPQHILSAESFLDQKFNLYPNPASNVVTITNSENLLVQQIAVYDTAGKLITTENYNNKTEIQLNVEHLASGTYLLHLKTNEGTAVKKLVKK